MAYVHELCFYYRIEIDIVIVLDTVYPVAQNMAHIAIR